MKKLLMFVALLFLSAGQYKVDEKVEVNKNDNTQYFTDLVKLIDTQRRLVWISK